MVPESDSRRYLLLAVVVGVAVGAVVGPSVNALPGFSDHTGPSEMRVLTFERVDSGCADEIDTYSQGGVSAGNYTQTEFIATERADANLSAWVERTSPAGADLSTFRVHVDSRSAGPENETCQTGVLYHVVTRGYGGSDEGFVPDTHGTEVVYVENGEYAGCTASVTSPLEACNRSVNREPPERTWANRTATHAGDAA